MAAPTVAAPLEVGGPRTARSRNPEIEGLRAVAALAVLVTHVSLNSMGNTGPFGGWLSRLDVGVAVFFVLSGYLLYRPFARSVLRDDDGVDLRRYLRHRLLRIVPAYWLVVVVSFLFAPSTGGPNPTDAFSPAASGATSVPLSVLARFLSFTQVYWKDSLAGPFPQAWTLATEMAFYLFLPLVFVVLRRRRGGTRAQRLRRQWALLGGMFVTAQLFRLGVVLLDPAYDGPANAYTQLKAWLPNHLDLFAAGMAMAVLAVERDDGGAAAGLGERLDRLFARRGAAAASFLVAFGALSLAGYGMGLSRTALTYGRLGEFGRHGAFLVVAVGLVLPALFGRSGGGPIRAFLSSRPMQFLGRISYGIYLWQIVVIGRWVSAPSYTGGEPDPARHPGRQFHVPFWSTLAWTLVLTIVLATITWYLVERPWLARKDRPIGWFAGGLWAIALASFASRVVAFGTATARNPGNGDPFYYHAQANMLADGLGFGQPIEWLTNGRFVETAIHPPLFTLWLTPASLLGARGFLAHKVLAALAGVGIVVVAALLARRLAGPRAGLLAAALVAVYPDLWVIDGTLWPEGLYTLAIGLALLAAYRWRDEPSLGRAALVGAGVGAAILTRGEALLLLPMLCLPLAWSGRKVVARWLVHAAVMGAVALGLLAPWTIRNLVTFDRPVPVSTNSEEVLYYANCPDTYDGPFIGYWSFACQVRARQERVARGLPPDPPGDEAERSAAWGELGREYALDHKDRWPAVVTARVTRLWDLQHTDNNVSALAIEGRPQEWSERGLWIYRLVLVPGLVGLWLVRRRGSAVWPLVSMMAMVTATAVYAYGHVRFRTAADLVLVVGAAVALDALLPGRRAEAADSDEASADDQPGPPGDRRPLETGAR
jgi:peptidoglycan/LPS O-acetylase OafA/YrhL